jgi:predicted GIY-YIG superfamily endonuclease
MDNSIAREKQLKNWHRQWKINLIQSNNPEMKDLSEDWYEEVDGILEIKDWLFEE